MDHSEAAVRDMRHWLERAVIGLNLCPFAKAVHVKGQVHYAVCRTGETADVLEKLGEELDALVAVDSSVRDTSLLILTGGFDDFVEFTQLMGMAEGLLKKRKLKGVVQLASFHPQFEFADAEPGAITNFTNRAPWPTIHLLREASIERAVAVFPEPEAIYGANMETLERLGFDGWTALDVGRHP